MLVSGLDLGHQSCVQALEAGNWYSSKLVVLCEVPGLLPRECPEPVYGPEGQLPSPQVPFCITLQREFPRHRRPVTRCPWHTCTSLQRLADSAAGRLLRAQGKLPPCLSHLSTLIQGPTQPESSGMVQPSHQQTKEQLGKHRRGSMAH